MAVDGHSIRLVATSSDFTTARVWIDDKEISGILAVQVRVAVPGVDPGDEGHHRVLMELVPDALDIEVKANKLDWFEERLPSDPNYTPPPPTNPGNATN